MYFLVKTLLTKGRVVKFPVSTWTTWSPIGQLKQQSQRNAEKMSKTSCQILIQNFRNTLLSQVSVINYMIPRLT